MYDVTYPKGLLKQRMLLDMVFELFINASGNSY